VRAQGDPKRVIDTYLMDVARAENDALINPDRQVSTARAMGGAETPPDLSKAGEGRWGSREVEITDVELRTGNQPTRVFESGTPMEIRLRIRAKHAVSDFVFGVALFNTEGVCCYGTNTHIDGARPQTLSGEAEVGFAIDHLDLVEGSYKLDVAVHRENGTPYDYHRLLYEFRVTSGVKDLGIYRAPHRWTMSGGVRIDGLK
jgi:hypothetical protein